MDANENLSSQSQDFALADVQQMTDDVAEAARIVPLHAETLSVGRRRNHRTVRVQVQTTTSDQTVDEILTNDRVVIDRVPVGRTVETIPPVREEGDTTIIPVVKEEVVVQRRLVLTEEIHVRRVRTTERHREVVVLRQQQATINRVEPGQGCFNAGQPAELAPIAKPQSVKGDSA
jgi:stress response protein YsnF